MLLPSSFDRRSSTRQAVPEPRQHESGTSSAARPAACGGLRVGVAGFHVARGVASGPKAETTIALTHPMSPHVLLGRDWLDKRERSAARFPADVPIEQHPVLDQIILGHAQFAAER